MPCPLTISSWLGLKPKGQSDNFIKPGRYEHSPALGWSTADTCQQMPDELVSLYPRRLYSSVPGQKVARLFAVALEGL